MKNELGSLTSVLRRMHLWLGLVTAVAVVAVSVTGVALNHRELLGLWNPPRADEAPIENAQPINTLLRRALDAAEESGVRLVGPGPRNIDRMLYRPGRATASVRFKDARKTEVVLDGVTGRVLQVAPRDDIVIEQVHSGEVVGQKGVILTDIAAAAVVLLTFGGLLMWLRRLRRRRAAGGAARTSRWLRLNLVVHTTAGVVVAAFAIVISVTGALLNHKRELGLMVEPTQIVEAEDVVKSTPARLSELVAWARAAAPDSRRETDVRWVDYRPLAGYAKVRFDEPRQLEVIVDAYEARVLSVAPRHDVLVEEIHSGAIVGARATLLSDATALILILLTLNGLYVWLAPASRTRTRVVTAADAAVGEAAGEPEAPPREPVGTS